MVKKNAISVLTRGYSHPQGYINLIRRNKSIFNEITQKFKLDFDILIFHEGNITNEHQNLIKSETPNLPLIFLNVKESGDKSAFDNSKNKINLDLCPPNQKSNCFPLGYKHMCHFWSIDFLKYLKDYKYVIRIDEDCTVIEFDEQILNTMEENNIYFSSPYFQGQDEPFVIVGMETLWGMFLSENNITPFKNFADILCPYTNFMIFDIEYINNNSMINKFLEFIDSSHGIYSNRWGDLPIWGMITSTLVDSKHTLKNNIKYYHGSHNKNIN